MRVTASWSGDMAFDVETGSGHSIEADGPPKLGGKNSGPRPMELMLASVATCSGIDVVEIMRKGGRNFDGVSVAVEGQRADAVPAVFTSISMVFSIPGAERRHAERAVQLSVEKYCSALRTLDETAKISWSLKDTNEAD